MYSCPVPVIARIHGDCYAGGLGLASVCDIRVVADGVTFSLSEARLGLLPATISPYVIRAMGEQAARRYFVTAERFGAAEAKAMGFAHEVVHGGERSTQVVDRFTTAIVANGPMATRACKQLVRDVAGREISAELRADTARRIADIRASAEGKEGIQSFLDKRAPAWLLPATREAQHEPRPDPARRHRRRARLGERPAPLRRRLHHRPGRLARLGQPARRPARAAATRSSSAPAA